MTPNPTVAIPPAVAAKAWRAYQVEPSKDSTDHSFLEQYLPLVKTTVGRMRLTLPTTLDLDDLYSVGVTGLMTAVHKFDPAQSSTFAAYAAIHIRGAVLDELRRMDWLSRGCREKAKKLKETIFAVEQNKGRPATEEEIREALGMTQDEYGELLEETKPVSFVPFDGESSPQNSEGLSLNETLADESQGTALDSLEKKELLQLVMDRIQMLPDLPKKVMAMYYFEEMRLAEIAAAFGLTEGRISQIHSQTVIGLRAFIENALKNSPASLCC